jgi:hypothetical protein
MNWQTITTIVTLTLTAWSVFKEDWPQAIFWYIIYTQTQT